LVSPQTTKNFIRSGSGPEGFIDRHGVDLESWVMTIGGSMSDSAALGTKQAYDKPATKKHTLRHLNGVRIIAALWVVAYHYQPQIYGLLPEMKFLTPVTGIGYLAVDLFFVLSGFIICYQYLGRSARRSIPDYKEFLIKRLARIYPAHATVLLALAALVIGSNLVGVKVSDQDNYGAWGFVMDLFLFRSWIGDSQGWNIPAWSLSAEWLAYALYPLIAVAAVWMSTKRSSAILGGASLLVALEGIATWIYPSSHMPVPAARILLAFSLGGLVYLSSKRTSHKLMNGWLGVASLGALMIIPALIPVGGLRASVALLLAGFTIHFLATGVGWPIRVLGSRPLNNGGLISFSLYLAHVPALMILVRVLPVDRFDEATLPIRAVVVLLYVALAMASGTVLYRLVEQPAHRRILARVKKRSRRADSPALQLGRSGS
jgi:peptidoglycan/LPS O-acetylase OafA/YrhL